MVSYLQGLASSGGEREGSRSDASTRPCFAGPATGLPAAGQVSSAVTVADKQPRHRQQCVHMFPVSAVRRAARWFRCSCGPAQALRRSGDDLTTIRINSAYDQALQLALTGKEKGTSFQEILRLRCRS